MHINQENVYSLIPFSHRYLIITQKNIQKISSSHVFVVCANWKRAFILYYFSLLSIPKFNFRQWLWCSYDIKIITDLLSIHFTARMSILSTRAIFIGKEPLMAFYSFQSIASYSPYNTYTLIYQSYYQWSTGIPIFKKRFVTFLSMCFRRVKTIFPVALKSSSGWFA